MKKLFPALFLFLISCASDPIQKGKTDSIVSNEIKQRADSANIPLDPLKKIDKEVMQINNSFLNGNMKRKEYDGETVLGWLYAYYEDDSVPAYIYTEDGGEAGSEQVIFYLRNNKLIFVDRKLNHFGKDEAGQVSPEIRVPYNERHVYFDGDAILKDTIVKSEGKPVKENYDFIKTLMTAQKLLKDAKVTGPR